MNANEVIANRALEILGHAKGDCAHLDPLAHVNMGQSTNDVYPAARPLCLVLLVPRLRPTPVLTHGAAVWARV
jgi:aspartate ammonia-lyase